MQQGIAKIKGSALLLFCLCLFISAEVSDLNGEEFPEITTVLDALERGNYTAVVDRVEQLRQEGLPSAWEKRTLYLLGHANLKLGNYADALIYLSMVLTNYPQMADYAVFNIARLFKETGYTFLYTESLRLLITQYPLSRLVPQVRLTLAQEEFFQQHFPEVVALLRDFQSTYEETVQAPEALFLRGQALEALQKQDEAIATYQHLYFFYPATPFAQQAEEKLQALKGGPFPLSMLYPDQIFARGERLMQAEKYEEAASIFNTLLLQKALADKTALLLLKLGTAYESLGWWKQALSTFEQVTKTTTDTPLLLESWYRLGNIQRKHGGLSAARTYFHKILSTEPKSEWSLQALYQLGKMSEDQENSSEAIRFYSRLVKTFPHSDLASEALWRIGWLEYSLRRYTQAAKHFQQLSSTYPHSLYRDNALFWLGKIQERQKKKAEAIATYRLLVLQYPYTYHSHRAEVHLQRLVPEEPLLSSNHAVLISESVVSLDRATLSEEIQFHFERAEELSILRFYEDSREEIRLLARLLPSTAEYRFLLSQLYSQAGFYLESIRTLNASLSAITPEKRLQLPTEFWSLLFPRLYWSPIQTVATENGIDPYLILSVIRQESGFQRNALSRSNAHGLMQLIPSTGQSLYRDLKGGTLQPGQLFEPELNITLGTTYLTHLLKMYDGNLILALASYNAGMGRVKQWRGKISEHDWDEFVENIPFNETRGYVKSVLRNYHAYQKLYQAEK